MLVFSQIGGQVLIFSLGGGGGGGQVLIFSQMTMTLDLIEEYLELRGYNTNRIDGTVPWMDRQVFKPTSQRAD